MNKKKKQETNPYFVATLTCIGLLGLVVAYYGTLIDKAWQKADYVDMKLELMSIDQTK